jgi:hypothetical protein
MLIEFFKDGKGYLSHTRLISIIGSFCVFGVFIYMPENEGVQNLMTILLTGSLINATASKFADKTKQNTEDNGDIKSSPKKIRRTIR